MLKERRRREGIARGVSDEIDGVVGAQQLNDGPNCFPSDTMGRKIPLNDGPHRPQPILPKALV